MHRECEQDRVVPKLPGEQADAGPYGSATSVNSLEQWPVGEAGQPSEEPRSGCPRRSVIGDGGTRLFRNNRMLSVWGPNRMVLYDPGISDLVGRSGKSVKMPRLNRSVTRIRLFHRMLYFFPVDYGRLPSRPTMRVWLFRTDRFSYGSSTSPMSNDSQIRATRPPIVRDGLTPRLR